MASGMECESETIQFYLRGRLREFDHVPVSIEITQIGLGYFRGVTRGRIYRGGLGNRCDGVHDIKFPKKFSEKIMRLKKDL